MLDNEHVDTKTTTATTTTTTTTTQQIYDKVKYLGVSNNLT